LGIDPHACGTGSIATTTDAAEAAATDTAATDTAATDTTATDTTAADSSNAAGASADLSADWLHGQHERESCQCERDDGQTHETGRQEGNGHGDTRENGEDLRPKADAREGNSVPAPRQCELSGKNAPPSQILPMVSPRPPACGQAGRDA
jgi:hypothetical protein